MRKYHIAILACIALITAAIAGCGHAPRYDQRLVQADSLMQPAPDSALAIVKAIDTATLQHQGDRAYHDLLLTQATYKAYQEITLAIDSAITRALNHYRHTDEREKLTRAYLYKGAIMEEFGHPDSAMYYYKRAEVNADEHDHVNLGQINTRMAALYRMYYGDNEICLDKYKRALGHYQQTGNKHLQQNSLYNMARCAEISKTEDSRKYISQSLELAQELNDSSAIYTCQELFCRILLKTDSRWRQAKPLALDCLHHYPQYISYDLMLDLAKIYAIENKIDSAKYYLGFVDENSANKVLERKSIKARKLKTLEVIAQKEGDVYKSNFYSNWCQELTDTILNNTDRYNIQRIENESSHERDQRNHWLTHRIGLLRWLALILGIALITAIAVGAVYHYRRERNVKAIIRELQHASSVNRHEDLLERIDEKDIVIERFVKNMVSFMQTSIEASEKDSPAVIRRRIKESVASVATKDFWNALRSHLDRNHNNIISTIAQTPNITESDLRSIELSCCGFDYVETAVILGYTPNYISQKRNMIARKLHLSVPLQDYLQQAMEK